MRIKIEMPKKITKRQEEILKEFEEEQGILNTGMANDLAEASSNVACRLY